MMHGLEKSDSAVVAVKPANKANVGSTTVAAEWVEPRAQTKGNADQPHTRRTQSRDSVSPGLERVRQAARQRKRQAFTALLTTSPSTRFEMRSWRSSAVPHRAWMA